MRETIRLNNHWFFKREYEQGMELTTSLEGFEAVKLPHTNVELPYSYFDEKQFQVVSCYKLPLTFDKSYMEKAVYLRFEAVMAKAEVYLNGKLLCEHKGGYTPFEVRLDEVYDYSLTQNLVTVVADARELENIPPFGGQIDYLTYGGIYREVSLCIYDKSFIRNMKIETLNVLNEEKSVKVRVQLENLEQRGGEAKLVAELREKAGKQICSKSFQFPVSKQQEYFEMILEGLTGIDLWEIDSPRLYELVLHFEMDGMTDSHVDCFGFRTAEFTAEGFVLNGIKRKLIGLNRHQAYPYVGYAMPKRVQERDAIILKNELHVNVVRTSHYPQSVHFLNKCDELGLLVFEEIPGWQHIGEQDWKEVAKQNVREMVQRDWNHPSIIIWGVRINESRDDDAFYTDTNAIAHALDGTRQTGGVRCIPNSSLLEDVYTYNDFNHDGVQSALKKQQQVTGLDHDVPYLVTEFNGHMFPTKRTDQEERQMEHALRHLRVLEAAYSDSAIAGSIGWCMYDYNTHKDFGSGDRICHHGVMDMFRIPKFAAFAYKSQVAVELEPVLEPVTFWARGERSIGGILPLVIFTNCDFIEFQYGDKAENYKRVYPSKTAFPGLPHAPVIIDYSVIAPEEAGAWGMQWQDAWFRGYANGSLVVEKRFSREPVPTELSVRADDSVLCSEEKDATRVVVKALDQSGNLLPFFDQIVSLSISGPGRIQGPTKMALKGGCIGFWVETINETGVIEIEISVTPFETKKIQLQVV